MDLVRNWTGMLLEAKLCTASTPVLVDHNIFSAVYLAVLAKLGACRAHGAAAKGKRERRGRVLVT